MNCNNWANSTSRLLKSSYK